MSLDFVKAVLCRPAKGAAYIKPVFDTRRCKDLMVRGHDFYAVWDDSRNVWSTNQDDVIDMIDALLDEKLAELSESEQKGVQVLYMRDSSTGSIDAFHHYVKKQASDNYHQLDSDLVFASDVAKRELYSTKRLNYNVKKGEHPAYDELMGTLYAPSERQKIEWCIGAILSGDSKKIQKFLVLYGAMGTGKSTVLNIVQMLFDGYYAVFDAEELGSRSASFALEQFKNNPLVAIQHDGDLSRIETNTRLNSIVSHEEITVNEKFKSLYSIRPHSFLLMGTNKPVKITDAKSGIIRRLIDAHPTGERLTGERYTYCMDRVPFELGAIAYDCKQLYLRHRRMYDSYVPFEMMGTTNDFYNFVEENYDTFLKDDCVTLKAAWAMYKEYVEYAKLSYPMTMRVFAHELENYFREYHSEVRTDDGGHMRKVYMGFRKDRFMGSGANVASIGAGVGELADVTAANKAGNGADGSADGASEVSIPDWLKMTSVGSDGTKPTEEQLYFDRFYSDCPAQYATREGLPKASWDKVKTKLKDIDTTRVHYLLMPDITHICIDFDLKDENGQKSLSKNLEAASRFPPTYAEVSKGGGGLHLHYIYTGEDANKLSRVFEDGIEVKVFTGKQSLRRRLAVNNGYAEISEISSGLPLKGDGNVAVNWGNLANEKAIRTIIRRNLGKEYVGYTKPSIDLIFKTLEEAYASGMHYDVTDLRPSVLSFATKSSNNSSYCIAKVAQMKWKSDEPSEVTEKGAEDEVIFFDVEVFPNLFVVCWKQLGSDIVVSMINPKSYEIEELCDRKLVGFNNRKYDNHILYGALLGYNNAQLYALSKRLIAGSPNAGFSEAYGLAWADIYDYTSKKQSLKKYEIDLDIHHHELGLPWDKPVPEDKWRTVAEYCCDDVKATEAVFVSKKRQADLAARQVLAELSGLTVSHTTQQHVTRIIFGNERNPKLVYTDLSELFPGYEFNAAGIDPSRYIKDSDGKPVFTSGKSIYMGEDPSEGGYVYAKPGMYYDVVTFDVASLHPSSILALNKFGEYTQTYREIKDARVAIKHGDLDKARKMLGGKLEPYLRDESKAKDLAAALKLILNSTYGYCCASFTCPFKDPRDVDNIVAKRGALFMITLKNEVIKRGFEVIHCKTDSIKIVKPTKEIADFICDFGHKYGYDFEIEAEYERICLVNRAVYIAKEKHEGWSATGAQFAEPYVLKTLFKHEPVVFKDYCVTKSVKSEMYLDMNEALEEGEHNLCFVGRCGEYCPIVSGAGGGILLRSDAKKEGKYDAVTGTKGYRWLESEMVKILHKEDDIDISYFAKLADEAVATISEFGDFKTFVGEG